MFESLVELRSRFLQLHSRPQTVRRLRAAPDKAVNLFLDVDERLLQDGFRIDRHSKQSKQRPTPVRYD